MPSIKRLARGFDIVSGFYDLAVYLFFGNKIDEFQTKVIKEIPRCDKAIIVGGGTGRVLKIALGAKLAERYCYVEFSEQMQKKTRTRLTSEELVRVSFNDRTDQLKTKADIAILPFVLDCYSNKGVSDIIRSLSKNLDVSSSIVVIDFDESSKWLQRAFIFMLYAIFRVVAGLETNQLPNYCAALDKAGYYLTKKETTANGWIFAAEFQKIKKIPSA